MLTKRCAQPVCTLRSVLGVGAAASIITAVSAYCAITALTSPVVKLVSARSAIRAASASVTGGLAELSFKQPDTARTSGMRMSDRIGLASLLKADANA